MRKITCDRCGAEIPKGTPPGYVCIQHEVDGALVGDNPFEGWDLCEGCLKEIIAFIDKKKRRRKSVAVKQRLNLKKQGLSLLGKRRRRGAALKQRRIRPAGRASIIHGSANW